MESMCRKGAAGSDSFSRIRKGNVPFGADETGELRGDILVCRPLLVSPRLTKAFVLIQDVGIKKGPGAVTTTVRDDPPVRKLLLASRSWVDLG